MQNSPDRSRAEVHISVSLRAVWKLFHTAFCMKDSKPVGIFKEQTPYIVQGDVMKKKIEMYGRGRLPSGWIFFAGFLLGSFFPNLMWKMEWNQKTAASLYLLGAFADKTSDGYGYLKQVIQMRGSFFLISSFCGVSVFGVPLAVTGILFVGIQTGMLLSMSILQFGLQGGVVGAGLLFPQYLIYIPCLFYLMRQVYAQSLDIWRSHGLFPKRVSNYAVRVVVCGMFWLLGILLEVYCNPIVVEILIKTLNLF